jgi:hypothetical protein
VWVGVVMAMVASTRCGLTAQAKSTAFLRAGGTSFAVVNWCSSKQRSNLMKVLLVLTSHDQLGNTGRKTGFWLEELAAPYYVFKDAGAEISLASPKGGQPPLDPKSNEPSTPRPHSVAPTPSSRSTMRWPL